MNEADTCRKYVLPKLIDAGWDNAPCSFTEQKTFTDGRIILGKKGYKRGKQKRADYLLRYRRDFPIAVVEAKADYKTPGEGMQQAKDYAEILGLKFAYATNGKEILEYDYITGIEKKIDSFPTPEQLWNRLYCNNDSVNAGKELLLQPYYQFPDKEVRYYQQIAINRAVQSVVEGKKRILITMATGTGKTIVAFEICWKLWSGKWNLKKQPNRRPKILFLADRNILVDDPKDKTFKPFGDARYKIEKRKIVKSREIYFAIYQAISGNDGIEDVYKEFAPDFFDLIIVDECHRGSANDEGKTHCSHSYKRQSDGCSCEEPGAGYDGFGKGQADNCIVAEADGKVVGAVWTRIMDDYGHVDDETPSFAISLYKDYRGKGIGTEMMHQMLSLLKTQGYEKASLAVQKANYAVKMYEKVGFKTIDENEEEYIMICEL